KILRVQNHPDFYKLIPHLKFLNEAKIVSQNTKSFVDHFSNLTFELLMSTLCLSFGSNFIFDQEINLNNVKKPDIIFEFNQVKWAIECKVPNVDNIKKGVNSIVDLAINGITQIESSVKNLDVKRGILTLNIKNLINIDDIWPA